MQKGKTILLHSYGVFRKNLIVGGPIFAAYRPCWITFCRLNRGIEVKKKEKQTKKKKWKEEFPYRLKVLSPVDPSF